MKTILLFFIFFRQFQKIIIQTKNFENQGVTKIGSLLTKAHILKKCMKTR